MTCSALSGFKALPLPIEQLCLSTVLKCGQSFRWTKLQASVTHPTGALKNDVSNDPPLDSEYRFCIKDRVICLRQSEDTLFYRAFFPDEENGASASSVSLLREDTRDKETLEFIRDYFQLKVDLKSLYDDWAARDPVFEGFQNRFTGIRILRQDPWECLISCVCLLCLSVIA